MAILMLITIISLLVPLGVFQRVSISPGINIYIHEIFLIPILLFVAFQIFYKKNIKRKNVLLAVSVFVITLAISLLLNVSNLSLFDFFVSISYLFRICIYFSVFFVFGYLSEKVVMKAKIIFALSGIVFIVFGILQYILYPSLKDLYVYGWDNHYFRLTSTYLDPNFAGIGLVLYSIYFISFFKYKGTILKTLVGGGVYLGIFSAILTYSRSTFLSLSSFFIFLIFFSRSKIIIVTIFTIIVLGVIFVPKNFSLEGLNPLRVFSSVERVKSINNALALFRSSPIYGIGFNAYRYAQKRHKMLDSHWEKTHSGAGASNSFAFILATGGILGTLSFGYLLFSLFKFAAIQKDHYSKMIMLSSLIAILTHSLFENSFFYPFALLIFCFIFGVMGYKKR